MQTGRYWAVRMRKQLGSAHAGFQNQNLCLDYLKSGTAYGRVPHERANQPCPLNING